jgi:hypothetical protein
MGRWTPLILMAGGLAILLGTLLGISFPMEGQNSAQGPVPAQRGKESKVLPANINVNSTAAGDAPANDPRTNVAQTTQNSNSDNEQIQESTGGTTDNPIPETQTPDAQTPTESNPGNEPIRALW